MLTINGHKHRLQIALLAGIIVLINLAVARSIHAGPLTSYCSGGTGLSLASIKSDHWHR